MDGVIVNFRRSLKRTYKNHMIIQVEGVTDKKSAKELVGKSVVWKSPAGKEIKGKIAKEHGTKGAVRAIFEKGMPGQSIGTKVRIG